jgi:hypothetical protein
MRTLGQAYERFLSARDDAAAPYEDCHAWMFTPASFELIVLELAELGVIDWRVERIVPQPGVEFAVHLRRGRRLFSRREAFEAHRLELLGDTMRDLQQQAAAFLGATVSPQTAMTLIAGGVKALIRDALPVSVRQRIARLRGRIP